MRYKKGDQFLVTAEVKEFDGEEYEMIPVIPGAPRASDEWFYLREAELDGLKRPEMKNKAWYWVIRYLNSDMRPAQYFQGRFYMNQQSYQPAELHWIGPEATPPVIDDEDGKETRQ